MTNEAGGVLCCYNSERHLADTLSSIHAQTRALDELVIIDDCSTDRTPEIIRHYVDSNKGGATRFVSIRNPKNFGISMSFNIGLKSCSTRHALLFSHDDINHPLRVEHTMDAFRSGAPLICSHMTLIGSDERITVPDSAVMIGLRMGLANAITAPTVAVDLNAIQDEKLFFNPQYDFAEDYDLWCQCLIRGWEFHVIPEALVAYRQHDGQTSRVRASLQQHLADQIRKNYISRLFPFFQENQGEIFLKVLVNRPDMVGRIDRTFIAMFARESQACNAPRGIQNIYQHVRSILATHGC